MTDNGSPLISTPTSSNITGPENLPPPEISLEFMLEPNIYSLNNNANGPDLTITITSHATRPITILTWGTLLDPDHAMGGMVYHIVDVESKRRVFMPIEHFQRKPFKRKMGTPDECYFWTLHPEEPRVITKNFYFATLWRRRAEFGGPITFKESRVYKGEEMRTFLEPGHRYSFGRPNAGIGWWRWGTKEVTLEPADSASGSSLGWSEPTVRFTKIKEALIEIRD